MSTRKVKQQNKYSSMPFWSLNGNLNKEELLNQIEVIYEMGFSGAFLHSRIGLETEYMSDEWMSLMRFISNKMADKGLQSYLYDEDRWPSGTAGGEVTKNPEYRLKSIVMREINDTENICGYVFIAKFLGDELLSYKNLNHSNELFTLDKKQYDLLTKSDDQNITNKLLVFEIKEMEKSNFYNGFTYVDTMNKDAIKKFIDITHNKYKDCLSDLFGNEIFGIFTDEPHRGAYLNGFGQTGEDALCRIPYTQVIFKEFEKKFDYKIERHLPALYFKMKGNDFSVHSYRYIQLALELFINNYFIPYSNFCKQNGISFTGHLLHEDNLVSMVTLCGSLMNCYKYMDYPGVDILGKVARPYHAVKMLTSIGAQFGKEKLLSEMYGATGWNTSFNDYKIIGDFEGILGINFRCVHLSWYTMKGEAKRDYPASIFFQSNWYKEYNYVEKYFERMGNLLDGERHTELLVLHPQESLWGMLYYKSFSNFFTTKNDFINKIEKNYIELCNEFLYSGIDFDYGDEGIIAESSRVEGNCFVVGNKKYKRVLVSGLYHIRKTTLNLLKEFYKNGGEVIFAGDKPVICDDEKCIIDFGIEKTDNYYELSKNLKDLEIEGISTSGGKVLSAYKKKGEDASIIVVNTEKYERNISIKIKNKNSVSIYNLRNGKHKGIRYKNIGKDIVLEYIFAPFEELALITGTETDIENIESEEIAIPVSLKYKLSEKNALVLDMPECFIDGIKQGKMETIKFDKYVREKFNLPLRGREMLQPWFIKKNYHINELCDIKMDFSFYVEFIPENLMLMTENFNDVTFCVNGQLLNCNFQKSEIDSCFKLTEIPKSIIKNGKNIISLSMSFNCLTDIENIYLLGDFGVRIDDNICTIIKPKDELSIGDITNQGLPFYSGNIEYYMECKKGKYILKTDNLCGLAYLKVIGKTENMLAFSPFESDILETDGGIILRAGFTRKNLFGPLHYAIADLPSTSPAHFMSNGENYSIDYKLIKQGLPDFTIEKIKD